MGPVLQHCPRAPIGFQLAGELQPCSQSIAEYRRAAGTLGPQLGGRREQEEGKGGELARKAEVETCHASGPVGCLKGLDLPLPLFLHTHTHKMRQGTICLQVSLLAFLKLGNEANKIEGFCEEC